MTHLFLLDKACPGLDNRDFTIPPRASCPRCPKMSSYRRPSYVLVAAGLAGLFAFPPATGQEGNLKPTAVNDASHLNRTEVAGVWKVPSDPDAAERQLCEILQQARAHKLRVSIAGVTHSMGGHTMYPGGIVLDMLPFNRMKLDRRAKLLHVGAGARWS